MKIEPKEFDFQAFHDIFETRAKENPNDIAIRYVATNGSSLDFNDNTLTYKQLNAQSNQLARYLDSKGYKAGVRFGVYLENSIDAVVCLLAIVKLGGCYVPLNVSDSKEANLRKIKQADLAGLIVNSQKNTNLSGADVTKIDLSLLQNKLEQQSPENLGRKTEPSDFAYIMFTSGSTGEPKGILVAHAGIINWVPEIKRVFDIKTSDRILQIAPISFDPNIWDVLMALSFGAELCISAKEICLDKDALNRLINEKKITHLTATPSIISLLEPKNGCSLKAFASTGEAFNLENALKFKAFPKILQVNAYGPTELTFGNSIYVVQPEDVQRGVIPIGEPVQNNKVYLLDEDKNPVKPGEIGEIYVAGPGPNHNRYLNDLETKEKFIENPFSNKDPNLKYIYGTGDLGRLDPKSNLFYFAGRRDNQIKLNGKRIELGAIKLSLMKHSIVQQAEVTVHGEGDHRCIVAYLYSENINAIKNMDWREHLREQGLSGCMIPSRFKLTEERFPLTINGKIDKKELERRSKDLYDKDKVIISRNKVEEKLLEIWSKVLMLDPKNISIDADFFFIGGNSILLQQLFSRIKTEFGFAYPIRLLLEQKTIAEQAANITDKEKEILTQTKIISEQGKENLQPSIQQVTIRSGFFNKPNDMSQNHNLEPQKNDLVRKYVEYVC